MQISTIANNNTLTMSSREIAELTSKEHKHVMRDIRVLKEQLKDLFDGVVQHWTHPQNGQNYEEFRLSKDTCLTLLLGYDVVARMKVVKRWQELEEKERFQNKLDTTAEQDIRILSAVSDMLRLPESGRISMVRKYIENETPKLKHYFAL